MAEKAGKEIYHGHDICLKKSIELLEEFGLPGGLLPLDNIEECGVDRESGLIWIKAKKRVDHYFKKAGRTVIYGTEIRATIQKNHLRNLTGVRAKEYFLSIPIGEILVDEPSSGKIHFKTFGGISKSFPVEAFAVGE
ncbi:hypothetical protein O6H91_07G037800 [Diphasiastrum complanatum]|uniref:Uncharacterized protein n=1 Tax=Diphasiastrum complanatum TaxID=34168 RepID=A0ACC2D430_DIPCM|nr:hypothetical protein O6H91_Y170800 [Diphasiastrum complanatum]KAJ7549045.1 hypothetical protein O6H91_07G037800 [Diphasiastrum complanatum]